MDFGLLSLGDYLPHPATGEKVSPGERIRSIVESGVHAEDLGFSTVAIGEHHFNDYIVSSPLMMLSAIASRTSRIRLTTAVTLLSILDPVRVAEDFSTLDLISNGRAELTLGRGISSDGYAEFGADMATSRETMADKLDLLRALLGSENVNWKSDYRPDLSNITLQPRPIQSDPRIWMGTGMSEDSVRWAAKLGLPLMLPSIFKPAEAWRDLVAMYRELMAESGNADRAFVGSCSHVHVAKDSQVARDEWRPYLTQYVNWANGLRGVEAKVDYDRIIDGPAMCGSPAEIAERLQSVQDVLQPDLHLAVFDIGGLPHSELIRTMELFSSDVMPQVHAGVPVPA